MAMKKTEKGTKKFTTKEKLGIISDIRPICSEVYTFGGNGSKDFTCLTDNNN
ncbi:MAG: hypothetical protein ACJAT4_002005 [Granulosicoccus sp.]|jgi:hypothetical protein